VQFKLRIKEVFTVCRDKICSINGTPIGLWVDEDFSKKHALLAQAENKTKVPFANRNGKPDKSDVSDTQVVEAFLTSLTLVDAWVFPFWGESKQPSPQSKLTSF
jgi:hypothetical protein